MSELRVYVRHIRAARPPLCTNAAPAWFAMRGLDWNAFLANGIPADILRTLNDPISNRALAAAEAEAEGQQVAEEMAQRSFTERRLIVRQRKTEAGSNGRR
jgi:hypothetical protein